MLDDGEHRLLGSVDMGREDAGAQRAAVASVSRVGCLRGFVWAVCAFTVVPQLVENRGERRIRLAEQETSSR
jgi:hypothetical protein